MVGKRTQFSWLLLVVGSFIDAHQLKLKDLNPPLLFRGGSSGPELEANLLAGRWVLDPERSESMTPFLVSVGAPRLIARMVGKKGKPITIQLTDEFVSIEVEGKEEQRFVRDGSETEVMTPKGATQATLQVSEVDGTEADGDEICLPSFTVTKLGPAEGETTTETYKLLESGALQATFSHTHPKSGATTTVVRVYVR